MSKTISDITEHMRRMRGEMGEIVPAPTLRWVKRRVVIKTERYKDSYGTWQTYDVVQEERVLQQAVKIDKAPGHKWVDVPEVEDAR